ncbi:MAG: hypothetical protein RBQ97_07750 [Acholeplasma sp.]|nr:hypothetical protein [Acholeplasma sp.]
MKINKNQALYRALPECWTTYSDSGKSDYKYACQVTAWNTMKVSGINEDMIKTDINRRVTSFRNAGGIAKEDFDSITVESFQFVEPALNENIPDIICKINPTTFYCQKCGAVTYKQKATQAPLCNECLKKNIRSKTNQLQMVYACECGYAEGVKPTSKETLFYHAKDRENQFKFYTASNSKREMRISCPVCNNNILPKNASDSRLFYSQSGNLVNLYNEKYADLIKKYKFDAEVLMLAKWFNLISNNQFLDILDDPKPFFEHKSRDLNDPEVIRFANAFNKTPEEIVVMLNASETSVNCIGKVKNDIGLIIPLSIFTLVNLDLITSELMEFDILKYPKGMIELKDALEKNITIGSLVDEKDVYDLLDKLAVKEIQVSEQVQIVNYAYGYTRLRSCPDGTEATSKLRLRGFQNRVFTTILDTEGILVELDMLRIYKWLEENDFIDSDLIIEDANDAKKWFLENINLNSITHFSTISGEGKNRATKIVFSLLHTISHMMIISAGKHSGLSRDSISEIIFANTCSFFLYPTSSEGVTLGSISGMFESELNLFLEDSLKENEICTFDPICKNNQNGACVACSYLSEVNCSHFNKDLSRSYLYGGTIKINDELIEIKRGFWK